MGRLPRTSVHIVSGDIFTLDTSRQLITDIDMLVNNPRAVTILRSFDAVVSFFLLLLISWRLFLEIKFKPSDNISVRRVVKFQLCLIWSICLRECYLYKRLDFPAKIKN